MIRGLVFRQAESLLADASEDSLDRWKDCIGSVHPPLKHHPHQQETWDKFGRPVYPLILGYVRPLEYPAMNLDPPRQLTTRQCRITAYLEKTQTLSPRVTCGELRKSLSYVSHLKKHVDRIRLQRRLSCHSCLRSFPPHPGLKYHKENEHCGKEWTGTERSFLHQGYFTSMSVTDNIKPNAHINCFNAISLQATSNTRLVYGAKKP